jgi:hypothetical protein
MNAASNATTATTKKNERAILEKRIYIPGLRNAVQNFPQAFKKIAVIIAR